MTSLLIAGRASAYTGWARATGGSGGPGTVPTFLLEVDDYGTTAPYGFEFIQVHDGNTLVERIGTPNGGFYPNYTSFTWTDPRGSSYVGTHNYTFGFIGWSPTTSHYEVAIAYASFTVSGPTNSPSSTSTSGPTAVGRDEVPKYTFTAHDADGDITQLEIAWRTPSGAVYAIQPWFDVPASSDPSVERSITFNQGAGEYQLWVNARDAGGRTRDPWAQNIPSERLTITVAAGNTPPTISISPNKTTITRGDSVSFTVTATDPDGNLDAMNLDMTSPTSGYFKIDEGPYTFTGSTPNNGYMSFASCGEKSQSCEVRFPNAGTYTLKGASRDPSSWYYSGEVQITVQAGTNGITWESIDLPTSGTPGETISFEATVLNSGTTTWTDNYYLELADQDWNHLYYPGLGAVAPGERKTVRFYMTLPSTAGTYTYHFTGMENGVQYFGGSQSRDIVVNTPPITTGITTSAANNPDNTIIAGEKVTFTGSATDADGNLAWVHFYIATPVIPPWPHIGSAQISGSSANGTFEWTTNMTTGSYSVHIRAQDTFGAYDSNASTMTSFNVRLRQATVSGANMTIARGAAFVPQVGSPYAGGSGNGTWQFMVHGYTTWPGRDSAGAIVSSGDIAKAGTRVSATGTTQSTWTPPMPGQYTYSVRKYDDGNYATSSIAGPYTLDVVGGPTITAQPQSAIVPAGGGVVLSVSATSSASITYQWYKDDSPLAGKTSNTLEFGSAVAGDSGVYHVVVTDSGGSTRSSAAELIVLAAPAPLSTNLTSNGFRLVWGAMPGATGYYVDVSLSASFSSFVGGYANRSVGSAVQCDVTGLLASTTYYFRVRAAAGGVVSPSGSGSARTTALDPAGDEDGDGLTNGEENLLGTSPTNAAAPGNIGLKVHTP